MRAARLSAVGGGGHVVLSETASAARLIAARLGVAVHPLGERQLKDIDEPERLYELDIEGVARSVAPPSPAEAPSRADDLAKQMSDRIEAEVMRSLERSLGEIGKPPQR